ADYYLVLRSECDAHSSVCGNVAAGAFNSNGNAWQDYLQNCPTSTDATCANGSSATYLDKYKYYINADLATYWPTAPAGWKPEVFAYHEWNDINNYILKNNASNLTCTSAGYCTVKIVGNLLNDPWWSDAEFWNSEVGLGQAGNPSPDDITQACAASYMLRVNTSVSPRFTRLYYMRAAESDGSIWSLFDSSQQPRPAFDVLANRNLAYVPPAGSTPAVCPAGPQTQIVNFSDPSNAGETINAPGVFTNALVAQAQDIYGNPLSGVSVTFGPATGLLFSNSASGPWNDTAVTTTLSNGNTSNVYVEAADEGTYTATASLTGVSSAAPVEFQNLAVVLPQAPPVSSLQIISDPTPPAAGKPATLSVALPAGASGTVEFTYNGGTALTCTNSGNPVTVAGDGTATCATTIPEGATSVSGTYTADGASAYASAALSTVTVQTGAAVDFAIAAASATQTVALGTPVSYTLNLSSINGSYDCPVTFIVAFTPALPPNATWSFSPASVTPASGASTTLTINIPKQTAMLDTTGFGVKAPLALAMLLLPLAAWRRRKSMGNLLIVLVLALAGLAGSAILGCGNDNNSSSSVAPKYQIDITGTGSCGGAHLTTVQLEVSK
ncbi:MAG: hypothetical protein FWD64_11420, partial [Acidobacteriaceae bacterium]|nr:hypothetical protein [Acidobacteriaceae bacterium]